MPEFKPKWVRTTVHPQLHAKVKDVAHALGMPLNEAWMVLLTWAYWDMEPDTLAMVLQEYLESGADDADEN